MDETENTQVSIKNLGLKPISFWLAMIGFAICNYVIFYYLTNSIVSFLFKIDGGAGLLIVMFYGYYSILILLILSALMALLVKSILKNNLIGVKASYLLVFIFLSISCGIIAYSHVASIKYYNHLITEKKISNTLQTYGEHEVTSDRQVVNTGFTAIRSSLPLSGIFFWIGYDDSELSSGNRDNLVILRVSNGKYIKEKIVNNATSAVMTANNKIYFVKNNLFEYDLATKQQKTILTNVGDIKSEYQGKIVLTYTNKPFVYDTSTGQLEDISSDIANIASDYVYCNGRYIYSGLNRYDINSHIKKDIAVTESEKYFRVIASNDYYSAYTIFDDNGTSSSFKIIKNIDNSAVFSEEISGTPNYSEKAKFIDNTLYVTVRDENDGNKYNIVKIDLGTLQKNIVFNLSDNGAGREDWDTDGRNIIFSTGPDGELILSPIIR
jgi:hypothetical protein